MMVKVFLFSPEIEPDASRYNTNRIRFFVFKNKISIFDI